MAAASDLLRAIVDATSLPRTLRLRWVTMRNDASWIVRDLRGEGRPVLVARGPSRYRVVAPIVSAPRPLRVERVVRETDDVVSIELAELDGAPLVFEAGQFLTFSFDLDGKPVRRAYSLSSSPLDGPRATITVKRMGAGSAFMHSLTAGSIVHARGPSGSFVAPKEPARLIMIAGGSGITPVISIAETVLRSRPDCAITLIYGSRSERDVIFRDRIDALKSERFEVHHLYGGAIDRDALAASIAAIPVDGPRVHYLCGPRAMMDVARSLLDGDVREERFQSPTDTAIDLPREAVVAEMKVGARKHLVTVAPGQTLLEAGLAAGAALPFSCAMGGCGACKVVLVSGEVHSEASCLTDHEREDGYVLACSSRPRGRVAIEVALAKHATKDEVR
jgi:ring-1,2-phenylacetyl-CoA epoxidase subunit PaaE